MSDHNRTDGEGVESGDTLTGDAAQDSGSPTRQEGARGRLPGLPGTKKDDCRPTYSGQPLSRIATENSPSAGWQAVYRTMGVRPDGHD
jgi:hypothetical protein